MPNVNKAIVMGVLGRDPETKNFPNGGSVTSFSVATTDHWKDKTTGELRANKPILIEYLKHTSRDLSMLVKRALDGYHWLLDRKHTHYRYNGVPIVTARIAASEWRETVKSVLKVNDAELRIIERLLIQSEQLVYFDHAKTLLTTPDQLEHDYMLDDNTGAAFNAWFSMPCGFIYS